MKFLLSLLLIFSSIQLIRAQNINVTTKRNKDNSVDFKYEKEAYGSYYVELNFKELRNSLGGKISKVVRAKRGLIGSLKPMDANSYIRFSYSKRVVRGNPNAKLDKDFTYILPFEKGEEIYVREVSNLGTQFNEEEPKNWTAYQFYTKGEKPVVAVRKGLVVKVVDGVKTDTTQSFSFIRSKNEVLIEHEDGTFARYKALKDGSVCVVEGQWVNPSDKIGLTSKYDKKHRYQLRFMISYLDKSLLENLSETKRKRVNGYLKPLFLTQDGIAFLETKRKYRACCTEELIMQEFSRREKKKYQKRQLN